MATEADYLDVKRRFYGIPPAPPAKLWEGVCIHGVPFTNTSIGCDTKCQKCSERGKIAGFRKAEKKALKLKQVS